MHDTVPDVRYVRSGDVNVAYCRWGNGRRPAMFAPPLVSNVELMWELPEWSRLLHRGGRVHDALMFDKRGTGLSDRPSGRPPTFEDHAEDLFAVLDRERIEQTTIVGFSEGGLIALVAAALRPERVTRVVIEGTPVMGATHEALAAAAASDNPAPPPDDVAEVFRSLVRHWATPDSALLALSAPGAEHIPHVRAWNHRFERQSASPGSIRDHFRSQAGFDIRPYLPRVTCPVFVAHARHDRLVHAAHGRLYVQLLPDAEHCEFEGDAHMWFLTNPRWQEIQDRIDGFLLSQALHDVLLGSGHVFVDRGEHTLKGVDGMWRLFAVEG